MSGALKGYVTPRVARDGTRLGDDVVRRTRAIVSEIGMRRAVESLAIGKSTLDEALSGGRVRPDTRERLLAALDRVELELAHRVAS